MPAFHAGAVEDPREMLPNPAEEARAEAVGRQLRCLVCQNEDIEDSGAGLARDLRGIVRAQVHAGRSNREIVAWMTARYGNFIRLEPGLSATTSLLWAMPGLALAAGLGAALLGLRRRGTPPPLDEAERARLAALSRHDP